MYFNFKMFFEKQAQRGAFAAGRRFGTDGSADPLSSHPLLCEFAILIE
jgi:hypothetical protein